jgi:hypothetical protein
MVGRRGVPRGRRAEYVTGMTGRFSIGWASLLAWVLCGLLPAGTLAVDARNDRSLRPAERGQSPLGSNPAVPIDPRLSAQPSRQGWPLDVALPADPFALAVRLIVLSGPAVRDTRPAWRTAVAFPYFPTGPPARS